MRRVLWRNAHVATMAEPRGFGLIERGAIVADDGTIAWTGREAELPTGLRVDEEHALDGALVTPGFVDAHTHLVYGGDRAEEFELRLGGASYEDIARAGGGIRSTVRATRAASDDELFEATRQRALALLAEGVTTIEIKSGYGLTAKDEARCLRVARRVGAALGIDVRTTYLAAHTVPPEFADEADAYIEAVCDWLPALNREGLVDAVDAFCERIAFTQAQTRRVFECARALGLPVKLHAEQLSDSGGAALAASFEALSCDHLEHLSPEGVAAMAASGTVAVLLPGAFYFLRDTSLPPIVALREAGVPIAIATDHNPGTSPVLSPLLMLQMACTLFRLTPEEAWRGMTFHGARALGLAATHGSLATGKRADVVVWDASHPRELCYWIGGRRVRRVFKAGGEQHVR